MTDTAANPHEAETAAVETAANAELNAAMDRAAEFRQKADQKSLLAQLRDWLGTVADDHPYGDLPRLARDAGWDWLLRQQSVQAGPNTIVVSFAVLIGRTGMDAMQFEYVDEATFALPAVPGPVSVAARAQINPTIIYMLFGRLPPQRPAETAPAETVVDMDDDDVDLDSRGDAVSLDVGGDAPFREDDIEPLVTGADVPAWEPGIGLPDVVVERVNGVPVFADLDDVKAPSGDVIVAVTNEVNAALVKMTTVDQVMDMWNRNEAVFGWLQDFATPEQRAAIAGAFKRRRGQIEGGFTDVAPRRRAVN